MSTVFQSKPVAPEKACREADLPAEAADRPARVPHRHDRIKKNIQEHARVAEMFATALDDGMRTLKQDGIEKVLQGITDIQQVRAVCIK
jgi:hypothetical protein